MKISGIQVLLAGAILTSTAAAANWVNPLEITNYKFFDSVSGKEFIARGVAFLPNANTGEFSAVVSNDKGGYRATSLDLFTDELEAIWRPHLKNLKDLNVNLVRLYAVDGSKSHDKFFCALSEMGMYATIEVTADCEGCYIDVIKPAPQCYGEDLKKRMQMIVNAFIRYPNLLGISVGNEVNFSVGEFKGDLVEAMACQKALVKDTRDYIDKCTNCRKIPVGVVISNQEAFEIAKYMNCIDGAESSAVQWFGINLYLEPGPKLSKTYEGSQWETAADSYKAAGLSVPLLATEYGAILNFDTKQHYFEPITGADGLTYENQRDWLQAGWLAGNRDLHEVFQGGVAFTYSSLNKEGNNKYPFTSFSEQNYGIGYASPENCDHTNVKCQYKKKPEFDLLAKQYKNNTIPANKLLTKASFKPDENRMSPPLCKSTWKKVSDIQWPTSAFEDLEYTVDVEPPTCSGSGSSNSSGKDNNSDGKNAGSQGSGNADEGTNGGQSSNAMGASSSSVLFGVIVSTLAAVAAAFA